MAKNCVSILGCGWLGKRIQNILNKDFECKCSSSFVESTPSFFECDVLIIAIPPSKFAFDTYQEKLQNSYAKQVILLSSTSVYAKDAACYTENSEVEKSRVLEIETLVRTLFPKLLVLRLAGLMGDDRIGGASVKSMVKDGGVNYVHYADIAQILKKIILANIHNNILNVVAPSHPLKSELFLQNSISFGFTMPLLGVSHDRVIVGDKLEKLLKYDFIHPNPLDFWKT